MTKQTKIGVGAVAGFVLGFLFWGFWVALIIGAVAAFCAAKFWPDKKQEEPASIEKDGYTKEAVGNYVAQIRGQLIKIRDIGMTLEENLDQRGATLREKIGKACSSLERVLSNLREDPEDMRFVGLLFNSVETLSKGLATASKMAVQGQSGDLFEQALTKGEETLGIIQDAADKKLSGAMAVGDICEMLGQFGAASEMAQHS